MGSAYLCSRSSTTLHIADCKNKHISARGAGYFQILNLLCVRGDTTSTKQIIYILIRRFGKWPSLVRMYEAQNMYAIVAKGIAQMLCYMHVLEINSKLFFELFGPCTDLATAYMVYMNTLYASS